VTWGAVVLGNPLHRLGVLAQARGDFRAASLFLEEAVEQQEVGRKANPSHPGNRDALRDTYWQLADTRLRLGAHRKAAEAAGVLPLSPDQWRECYQAARLLTRCVALAGTDAQLSAGQRREAVQEYAGRAVERLREAVRRGYKDLAFLRKDPGLDVLRSRADFQKLLAELAERTSTPSK
jgi:hypothetical protein